MDVFKKSLLLLLSVCVSACATLSKQSQVESDWPEDIPALSHYQSIYTVDEENQLVQTLEDYLTWVTRFYKGWGGFAKGWEDASVELTKSVSEERSQIVESKLLHLGQMVSGEWAKKSNNRLIYSDTLSIWGNALSESIYQSNVEELVDRVTVDAESLLSSSMVAEEITMQRYFPDLDFEEEFSMQ